MPTITNVSVLGFAHCPDPRCDPHQHETPVLRESISYSYIDNGGDFPGEERSSVSIKPVPGENGEPSPTISNCATCGKQVELTDHERSTYVNDSGVDPNALLGISPQANDPRIAETVQAAQSAAAIEALQAQLAALTAQFAAQSGPPVVGDTVEPVDAAAA